MGERKEEREEGRQEGSKARHMDHSNNRMIRLRPTSQELK